MNFVVHKAPIEVTEDGAFVGTYFRDICSSVNKNWYKKSWKEFDHLKNIGQKCYFDASVNKYVVKCRTPLRF